MSISSEKQAAVARVMASMTGHAHRLTVDQMDRAVQEAVLARGRGPMTAAQLYEHASITGWSFTIGKGGRVILTRSWWAPSLCAEAQTAFRQHGRKGGPLWRVVSGRWARDRKAGQDKLAYLLACELPTTAKGGP